jgi:hypothetical protein
LSSGSAKFVTDSQPPILQFKKRPERLRHFPSGRVGRPSIETTGGVRQDSIAIGLVQRQDGVD